MQSVLLVFGSGYKMGGQWPSAPESESEVDLLRLYDGAEAAGILPGLSETRKDRHSRRRWRRRQNQGMGALISSWACGNIFGKIQQ